MVQKMIEEQNIVSEVCVCEDEDSRTEKGVFSRDLWLMQEE